MNFYIDFEATQFSNRIIAIGCICENGNKFKTFVKPAKGKLNQFITDLTGITEEMLEDAPSADFAFNALFDFVMQNCLEGSPKYFCYGNSDHDFLLHTVSTMTEPRAISFVYSIYALMNDYSKTVSKYFSVNQIGLKKVVTALSGEEIEQKHDALEDAEMLAQVFENLKNKISTVNEDLINIASPVSKKKKVSKSEKNSNPAPAIYNMWKAGKINAWSAETGASAANYKIKVSSPAEGKEIYFPDVTTAALWLMKYKSAKGSPKNINDVQAIEKHISSAIKKQTNYYTYNWEE